MWHEEEQEFLGFGYEIIYEYMNTEGWKSASLPALPDKDEDEDEDYPHSCTCWCGMEMCLVVVTYIVDLLEIVVNETTAICKLWAIDSGPEKS